MSKEKDRDIKPISFNLKSEYDKKLLSHIESTGMAFGTYVKNLIERDMNKNLESNKFDVSGIVDAINNLTDKLMSNDVRLEPKANKEISVDKNELKKLNEDDKETKSIIDGILGFKGR